MCWCTPGLRTPNCGKAKCIPPSVANENKLEKIKLVLTEVAELDRHDSMDEYYLYSSAIDSAIDLLESLNKVNCKEV